MLKTPTLRNSGKRSDLRKRVIFKCETQWLWKGLTLVSGTSAKPHVKLEGDRASQQLELLRMELPCLG